MVFFSFTGDLSEPSLAENEVFIKDLINLKESETLFPLHMEEKVEFPTRDEMEEETTRELCLDVISIVPEVSSPPMLSQQLTLPMEYVDANISGSILAPSNNFIFFIDPLWHNFVHRQLCLKNSDTIYLLQKTGFHHKVVRWVVSCGHKEELGGPSLAEERKEQLEQLTPPMNIIDPSFAIRWSLSSRSKILCFLVCFE